MKVTVALLVFEVVFVNCVPVAQHEGYVAHSAQNAAYVPEQAAHAAQDAITNSVKEDAHSQEEVADVTFGNPGKGGSTSTVTVEEQNFMSPGPIAYLPSFLQGILPTVVTQTIAQLASYISGFQRSGVLPQPNLPYPYTGFVGSGPSYSGYPEYLSQRPLYYSDQPGYIPGKPGFYPSHIGYFQRESGQWPTQSRYYPDHPGYVPSRSDYFLDQPGYPPFQRYPPGYGVFFPHF